MGNVQTVPPAFTSACAFVNDTWTAANNALSNRDWASTHLRTEPYRGAYQSLSAPILRRLDQELRTLAAQEQAGTLATCDRAAVAGRIAAPCSHPRVARILQHAATTAANTPGAAEDEATVRAMLAAVECICRTIQG